LTVLSTVAIQDDVTVTIQLADGTYTYAAEIALRHPYASQITITGANTYDKTISSIQSASGAAPNRSVILNLNNVANIAVNDYAMIMAPSGGTSPLCMAGLHKITNVDAGNSRITVLNASVKATYSSGAVTGTLTVMKTMLDFSASVINGFACRSRNPLTVTKMVLVGQYAATTCGIDAVAGCLTCVAPFGICNFYLGIYADQAAVVKYPSCVVTHAYYGFDVHTHSSIHAVSSVLSGNYYCCNANGASFIDISSGLCVGSDQGAIIVQGTVVMAQNTRFASMLTRNFWVAHASTVYAVGFSVVDAGTSLDWPPTNTNAYTNTAPVYGSWFFT
jgi:hypothetical protein